MNDGNPMQGTPPSLPLRDYLVAATLLSIILLMAVAPWIKPYPALSPSPSPDVAQRAVVETQIHVYVSGAVKHPGSYWVPKGSTIGELLDRARPTELADLKRVKRESQIQRPRTLSVRQLPSICVHVFGAVEAPGSYQLKKGTRFCDLPECVKLAETADLSSLKSSRRLKEGELVEVAYQLDLVDH